MAITIRTTAQTGGAERKQKLHRGMALALGVEIQISVTGDYTATGIPLTTIAKQLGFSRIIGAVGASVRASGGALRAFMDVYDVANNSIRFYKSTLPSHTHTENLAATYTQNATTAASAAASAAMTEITPGTDLAANDIVSLVVYGVP